MNKLFILRLIIAKNGERFLHEKCRAVFNEFKINIKDIHTEEYWKNESFLKIEMTLESNQKPSIEYLQNLLKTISDFPVSISSDESGVELNQLCPEEFMLENPSSAFTSLYIEKSVQI